MVIALESSCTTLVNRRDLYSPAPDYSDTVYRPVVTKQTTTTTTTTHIEEPPPQMAPPMPEFR
jgi:hypothetical protein